MSAMNARLVRGCGFLALPALGCLGALAYFLAADAGDLLSARKREVTLEYKEAAAELLAGEVPADYEGPRGEGWRVAGGKLTAGDGTRIGWGHNPTNGLEMVWYPVAGPEQVNGRVLGKAERRSYVRGRYVEPVSLTRDYLIVYALPSVAVAIILVMTIFALRFFCRYTREREDFFAAAVHDFTTPLAGLRGMIGVDDAEAQNLVNRMYALIGNLREFLRLGARRPQPQLVDADLVALFDEAYRIFAADFADSPGGEVRREGLATLPAKVDVTLTLQILWNLLGNALKYAAPHGPVTVRFAVEDGRAVLALADEAAGLSAAERRRVFERYYRAPAAVRSGAHGFGIGLSTARELSRAMGGELTVAANSPQGTVFALRVACGIIISSDE